MGSKQMLPMRRIERAAGEEGQVDFGSGAPVIGPDGKRRKTSVFRIVLSHSRKAHSEAKRSGEYLFEIIMRRYEVRSTIMTSNRPLEDWGKLIGDVSSATAILDRSLHHAEIVSITGRSYRLRNQTGPVTPPDTPPTLDKEAQTRKERRRSRQ